MFGNLGKMMKIAGELKTKLPEMQERLANTEFTADAGGGVVSATVNGKLKLVGVRIAPELIGDPGTDAEFLGELVTAAVAAAQEQAALAVQQEMAELTGGMEIPGLTDMM